MRETVKLIIEIPRNEYEQTCNLTLHDRSIWDNAIRKGIPLDDVKAEIETDLSWEMFDEYGNETALHEELWEILDNIGKGE